MHTRNAHALRRARLPCPNAGDACARRARAVRCPLSFGLTRLCRACAPCVRRSATKTPEWTTWGLLAAVSVWDLIAVLTPRGPLKMLVEEAEARGEPIPGLVYQGADIKLGLGDFVFYSVLVGRASMRGSATLFACAVAVLAGLCATLALLPILQKVLPALPISIAVGILFYFTSWLMLTPMSNALAIRHVFL